MRSLKLLLALLVIIHHARGHAVLVGSYLAHPARGAQLDPGALRDGPIGDVGTRLCPLSAARGTVAEVDAAGAPLVIHGRDRGVGRPPMPTKPGHRLAPQRAGSAG